MWEKVFGVKKHVAHYEKAIPNDLSEAQISTRKRGADGSRDPLVGNRWKSFPPQGIGLTGSLTPNQAWPTCEHPYS